jgi:hypothetical protein
VTIRCPTDNCPGELEASPRLYLSLDDSYGELDISISGIQNEDINISCDENGHILPEGSPLYDQLHSRIRGLEHWLAATT